jgi:hypothetical protein
VKKLFFEPGRFSSWESMSAQLFAWKDEINTKWPSRHTGAIPASRIEEERAHLRPVAMGSEEFALRMPAVVGSAGEVVYDGVPYTTTAEMVHQLATVHVYCDRIVIIVGDRVVQHERRPAWPFIAIPRPGDDCNSGNR